MDALHIKLNLAFLVLVSLSCPYLVLPIPCPHESDIKDVHLGLIILSYLFAFHEVPEVPLVHNLLVTRSCFDCMLHTVSSSLSLSEYIYST